MHVFYDNKIATSLLNSGARSTKGKHIGVSYHYTHDIPGRRKLSSLHSFRKSNN